MKTKYCCARKVFVMGLLLALAATVAASEHQVKVVTNQRAEVDDLLARLESQSIHARRDAATLESLARNRQVSWKSHSEKLNHLKNHVNKMGKLMTDLEARKDHASLIQQKAIESARPHVSDITTEVENSIKMLNEDHGNIRKPQYQESTKLMYEHADTLYKTVDAIIDYKNARLRLHELYAPPAK